jgi:hypothetical protein
MKRLMDAVVAAKIIAAAQSRPKERNVITLGR